LLVFVQALIRRIWETKSTISDKRQAILKAALNLFTEQDFHNTPTSLIAREAGAATATLFHHFKNKEILILLGQIRSQMLNYIASGSAVSSWTA